MLKEIVQLYTSLQPYQISLKKIVGVVEAGGGEVVGFFVFYVGVVVFGEELDEVGESVVGEGLEEEDEV